MNHQSLLRKTNKKKHNRTELEGRERAPEGSLNGGKWTSHHLLPSSAKRKLEGE